MKTIDQIRALCEGCSGPEMCPAELTAGDVLGLLVELKAAQSAQDQAQPVAWTPTSEAINALPEPIRKYICALETNCDPAGIVADNAILRDCNQGLQIMYRNAFAEGVEAAAKIADAHTGRPVAGEVLAHALRYTAAIPDEAAAPQPPDIPDPVAACFVCGGTAGHWTWCTVPDEANSMALAIPPMPTPPSHAALLQAAQQALEALEWALRDTGPVALTKVGRAIDALRAAIKESE